MSKLNKNKYYNVIYGYLTLRKNNNKNFIPTHTIYICVCMCVYT